MHSLPYKLLSALKCNCLALHTGDDAEEEEEEEGVCPGGNLVK